jgi:hypothetical protein
MKLSPALDDGLTWDQRIFAVVDSGVDDSLLRENLKLSPTERIEKMREVLLFAEESRRARGHKVR